jgi:hypothetical protein
MRFGINEPVRRSPHHRKAVLGLFPLSRMIRQRMLKKVESAGVSQVAEKRAESGRGEPSAGEMLQRKMRESMAAVIQLREVARLTSEQTQNMPVSILQITPSKPAPSNHLTNSLLFDNPESSPYNI